jgi:hypothetical protein
MTPTPFVIEIAPESMGGELRDFSGESTAAIQDMHGV